jgi:hypothetical protein
MCYVFDIRPLPSIPRPRCLASLKLLLLQIFFECSFLCFSENYYNMEHFVEHDEVEL